jgi:hypothetical protein
MLDERSVIAITFHGRSEGIEEVQWPGTNRVERRPCGLFVDAYTIGGRPEGCPPELWVDPRFDFQIVLDLWLAEPDRRSILSPLRSIDREPTDWLTVHARQPFVIPHDHIVYRLGLPFLDPEDHQLVALFTAWVRALELPSRRRRVRSRSPRPDPPPDTLAAQRDEEFHRYLSLDFGTVALVRLSPEARARANAARRALIQYMRARDRLRPRWVAHALDSEAAAWVEIVQALKTGASARACDFCQRYFLRPAGYKRDRCRNCSTVLRAAWRVEPQLMRFSREVRAHAARGFWHDPGGVARDGVKTLETIRRKLAELKRRG